MRLTEKQRRFAEAYCNLGNITRAAREAGYSHKSAPQTGRDTLELPHVKAAIEKIQAERRAAAVMKFEEAQQILTDIARATVGQYFNEQGAIDIEAIKTQHPHAVESVKQVIDRDGNPVIQFKLHSKIAALERLAKLLGWDAPEKHEHDVRYEILVPEDLDGDGADD